MQLYNHQEIEAGREALARAVGVERDGERARSVGPALGPGGKLLRDGIGLCLLYTSSSSV